MVIETGRGLPLEFPFTPGSDLAGTVVAAGDSVTRFAVGDEVISVFTPDWLDGARAGDARTPSYWTLGGFYPGMLAKFKRCRRIGLSKLHGPCRQRRPARCRWPGSRPGSGWWNADTCGPVMWCWPKAPAALPCSGGRSRRCTAPRSSCRAAPTSWNESHSWAPTMS
ncbi:alcohol dehydrogenase catalytic domain-containing protein [Mycolicibacterium fortuitum]|uniref:alcohol dehydrogenase catalytic domain-containing protein n=1 Tax=Mycolicibacterium fortuitum TaxID=1766 RepID=UPI002E166E61